MLLIKNTGFIWGVRETEDGWVSLYQLGERKDATSFSYGHLSFIQYHQHSSQQETHLVQEV